MRKLNDIVKKTKNSIVLAKTVGKSADKSPYFIPGYLIMNGIIKQKNPRFTVW